MKYEKSITLNLGNYESLRIGVADAPNYEECDKVIIKHLQDMKISVDRNIRRCLNWIG